MDSELHMHSDQSNRLSVINDGIPPQLLPESFIRSTLCQLNTHNESIIGLPMFPSLQGESSKDHHADRTMSYDGMINKGNLNFQELCLASRNGLNDDLNNPVVPLQQDVFPTGCAYVSSCSVPTSNCGYDTLVGDVNGKWDQNRFMMQPELSWRASTSGMEALQFNENQDANQWLLPNSANELSSSLATCRPSLPGSTNIQDRCSDMSCSSAIDSQPQTRLGLECSNKDLSLGFVTNDRTPRVSQMISGSRYLGVLQQILSDIANYSLFSIDQTSFSTGLLGSSSNHTFSSNHFNDPGVSFKHGSEFRDDDGSCHPRESSCRRQEVESRKAQLLALLQVVDDCYTRCLDEIHTVISAFHAATELDPQVHACFALRTISFFYKSLRERISNEILTMGMNSGSTRDNERSFEKSFIQKQWALQQLKRKDQQLWRPQRGLPERSVSVLRAWMFDNFLHPYPKDAEKHLLAIKSGLTRSQVSNWFINARVRLWKPLVEEMCAELNRKKATDQSDEVTNYGNNHRSQLTIYDYNQRFNS